MRSSKKLSQVLGSTPHVLDWASSSGEHLAVTVATVPDVTAGDQPQEQPPHTQIPPRVHRVSVQIPRRLDTDASSPHPTLSG